LKEALRHFCCPHVQNPGRETENILLPVIFELRSFFQFGQFFSSWQMNRIRFSSKIKILLKANIDQELEVFATTC
jgi:hypothetical protein